MKKIYLSFFLIAGALVSNAQNRAAMNDQPYNKPISVHSTTERAEGDTLFWFDGNSFRGSIIDTTVFDFRNDDADGKTVDANLSANYGPTSSFVFFYQLAGPNQDTNSFISATSWFTPVGQADNWFAFGPLNIPTGAANYTLTWHHNMPDGDFRDGYKIMASTTGPDYAVDFTSAPLFSVGNNAGATIGDTVNFPYVVGTDWGAFEHVWYPRSVDITQFAGQTIYLAIHHDANDMFIVHFDDILITEGPLSIEENQNTLSNVTLSQNQPNPFNSITTIQYALKTTSNINLTVTDLAGRIVKVVENQKLHFHSC
jgi:hypothetical protein